MLVPIPPQRRAVPSEVENFLRRCWSDPADDLVRLIYCDWLEGCGLAGADTAAALIRHQLAGTWPVDWAERESKGGAVWPLYDGAAHFLLPAVLWRQWDGGGIRDPAGDVWLTGAVGKPPHSLPWRARLARGLPAVLRCDWVQLGRFLPTDTPFYPIQFGEHLEESLYGLLPEPD